MINFVALLKKDFFCIWRSKQMLLATLGFSMLLVVVSSFAFRQVGYGEEELLAITPGILWIIFLFTASIGLNQSFQFESENDALSGLLLSGADPMLVYTSKFIANLTFLFLVQTFAILVHSLLFGAVLFSILPAILFITFLTAIGFIALGSLFSGISASISGRELILPILLFPLSLPLLAAAVHLSRDLLLSGNINISNFWFILICAFDLIALSLSLVLFEYLVFE